MPTDTYTLSIEGRGFQPQVVSGVNVIGDATTSIGVVSLQAASAVIGKVVARAANSAYQPGQTVDATTLSGDRITQALGNPVNNNEAQLLLAAPGVEQNISGAINIRGSQTTEIGYQLAGVNFTAPFFNENGSGGLNKPGGYLLGMNGGTGGSVQVVSGSGDATQGNIGAGVVNIVAPRGTYPQTAFFGYTFDSPYRNNQYDLNYGYATPNGVFSNYLAFEYASYVPQYAPYGTSSQNLGETAGTSNTNYTGFLDHMIFKFGKDQSQNIDVLYRYSDEAVYAGYGGNNTPFYTYNPLATGNYVTYPGLGISQYEPLPGIPSGQVYPQSPFQSGDTPTTFTRIAYNATIGTSTFVTLDWFNWYQSQNTNTGASATPAANVPFYQSVGGQRAGGDFSITEQFGQSHTVTLATRFEDSKPRWLLNEPPYGGLALLVQNLDSGGNGLGPSTTTPSLSDFTVPVGGVCPIAGGCYLYNTTGQAVQVPTFGIDYHNSTFQDWGVGIRDQWTVNQFLKLDYGIREDGAQYKFGCVQNSANPCGNPSDLGTTFTTASFLTPHIVQPRIAAAITPDANDAIRLGFGRSVEFAFGQNAGTPFNTDISPILYTLPPVGGLAAQIAAPTCGSGYNNTPQNANAKQNPAVNTSNPAQAAGGANAPYFFPCTSYGQQLWWAYDQVFDAPDYGGQGQETFSNYDVAYSHQFTTGFLSGWGTKLTGWWRRGYNVYESVGLASGPPNPATGQTSNATFLTLPNGIERAFGAELSITTPDKPVGFSGYATLNYLNEFTTVPPVASTASSNQNYASDQLPGALSPQVLAANLLFRSGTLPPFDANIGIAYKTKGGIRINPIINATTGYPVGVGNQTVGIVNGQPLVVPATNMGASGPIGGAISTGALYNAPNYVDPSLPGSYLHPNIAATRGTTEGALPGDVLSRATFGLDIDFEYDFNFPGETKRQNTVGMYIMNVMNNHYGADNTVFYNTKWQPVATGIGGPQTGQNLTDPNPSSPFYGNYLVGLRDQQSFNNGLNSPWFQPYGAGTVFQFYIQRKL